MNIRIRSSLFICLAIVSVHNVQAMSYRKHPRCATEPEKPVSPAPTTSAPESYKKNPRCTTEPEKPVSPAPTKIVPVVTPAVTLPSTPMPMTYTTPKPKPTKPITVQPKPTAPVTVQPKPTTPAPITMQPTKPSTHTEMLRLMLKIVNQKRRENGKGPLCYSSKLNTASQKHSDDQARMRRMSHTGSNGSTAGGRITSAGFTWSSYAENVAWNQKTVESVMESWMNSPGHRKNLLGDFKYFGAGETDLYWTQNFGGSSSEQCVTI